MTPIPHTLMQSEIYARRFSIVDLITTHQRVVPSLVFQTCLIAYCQWFHQHVPLPLSIRGEDEGNWWKRVPYLDHIRLQCRYTVPHDILRDNLSVEAKHSR
jgi:hypothetical protein